MTVYNHTSLADEELIIHVTHKTGVLVINRPQSLNALSLEVIRKMTETLLSWRHDDNVQKVILEGAGEKAFCAGGDIRAVYMARKNNDRAFGDAIFREEYFLNHLIHTYEKPIISMINGYCMGGGMGVSVHGKYRIVTERASMAMPETTIGFFPDVGAGYFLNQCPDGIGLWLGILGERIFAADTVYAGLATHYAPSQVLNGLKSALLHQNVNIDNVLSDFCKTPPISTLKNLSPYIEEIFGNADSLDVIFERLQSSQNAKAKEWLEILSKKSPTSLKLSFETIKRARGKSIADVLKQEFRLSQRCVDSHDFCEGVRALLIDKDQSPQWSPAFVKDVKDEYIETYFSPLTDREELSV